jgi:hypothetical protein
MSDSLPNSVRYVKNGQGGKWWKVAKSCGQIHLGWSSIPHDLLLAADYTTIESMIRAANSEKKGAATQDFNALRTLLDHPSQHLWVTFEDGCMWWCTVRDGINVNHDGAMDECGHFWLTCETPWKNYSLDNRRYLAIADLPGITTTAAAYRATVCEPKAWQDILRIIKNKEDPDVEAAAKARASYEKTIASLVSRLRPKDFEMLIDLILSNSGWKRLAKLGGTTEGIDIEVENPALDEIAFVQVKSTADQDVLDDYISRFRQRDGRYSRMIFAVHSPRHLKLSDDPRIQVWAGEKIANLVVRLGLGDWVAKRL